MEDRCLRLHAMKRRKTMNGFFPCLLALVLALKALAITVAGDVVVGSISIISLTMFDKMDVFTCNYLVVIGAFIIAIFTGWVWEIDNFLDAANVKVPLQRTWLRICVKYVCPVAIAIIFIGNFVK